MAGSKAKDLGPVAKAGDAAAESPKVIERIEAGRAADEAAREGAAGDVAAGEGAAVDTSGAVTVADIHFSQAQEGYPRDGDPFIQSLVDAAVEKALSPLIERLAEGPPAPFLFEVDGEYFLSPEMDAAIRRVAHEVSGTRDTELTLQLPDMIGKVLDTRAALVQPVEAPPSAPPRTIAEIEADEADAARIKADVKAANAAAKRHGQLIEGAARAHDACTDESEPVAGDALTRAGVITIRLSDGATFHPTETWDVAAADFASEGSGDDRVYAQKILLSPEADGFVLRRVAAITSAGTLWCDMASALPFGDGRKAEIPAGDLIFRPGVQRAFVAA